MKRYFLFKLGKFLDALGRILAKPGDKLFEFGMELWDKNCDCIKCQERRNR